MRSEPGGIGDHPHATGTYNRRRLDKFYGPQTETEPSDFPSNCELVTLEACAPVLNSPFSVAEVGAIFDPLFEAPDFQFDDRIN